MARLDVEWHNDDHEIELTLDHDRVTASPLPCPYEAEEEPDCHHPQVGCMFEWFVNLYGLECNVGVSPARSHMKMAWSLVGNMKARDIDACQLWMIPADDEIFASWMTTFTDVT